MNRTDLWTNAAELFENGKLRKDLTPAQEELLELLLKELEIRDSH